MHFNVDIFDAKITETHTLLSKTFSVAAETEGGDSIIFYFHSLEALEEFGKEVSRYAEDEMRKAEK